MCMVNLAYLHSLFYVFLGCHVWGLLCINRDITVYIYTYTHLHLVYTCLRFLNVVFSCEDSQEMLNCRPLPDRLVQAGIVFESSGEIPIR